MSVRQMDVGMDLTEGSIRQAATLLGVRVEALTVYAARHSVGFIDKLDGLNCSIILVPDELFANKYAWAATCGPETVWSNPSF
jgi:hypothetical protein